MEFGPLLNTLCISLENNRMNFGWIKYKFEAGSGDQRGESTENCNQRSRSIITFISTNPSDAYIKIWLPLWSPRRRSTLEMLQCMPKLRNLSQIIHCAPTTESTGKESTRSLLHLSTNSNDVPLWSTRRRCTSAVLRCPKVQVVPRNIRTCKSHGTVKRQPTTGVGWKK